MLAPPAGDLCFEVVDESSKSFEGFLLCLVNPNGNFYGRLDGSAQVQDLLEVSRHEDMLAREHGLDVLELVHSVVHLALQILYCYNLIPHNGKQR